MLIAQVLRVVVNQCSMVLVVHRSTKKICLDRRLHG
jgi:hypothetical protein